MSAADEADDLLENESATTEGPGPSSLGTTPAPGLGRGAAAPLRQSPAPSLPQRAPDSFDEWYASLGVTPAQRHEQQVRLKAALESAAEMTPERARRIMFMRTQTGLPPEYINSNLEDVERAHRIAGGHFDLAKFQERNPGLAAWIAAHPESGALAKDEIAEWSALEWVLGRWHFDPRGALDFFTVADGHAPFPHERGVVEKIVRGEGSDQVESADLGFKRLMGSATPADLERLKQLDAKTPVDWGDRNWFSHGVVVQSRMLPYEWGAIKAGGAGAGIGAAGGALVAGIPAAFAGPEAIGPAALGGARVGAKWAGGIGSALYTAKQEAGGAFNEYMEMPGMDENAARVAALLVGAVNGGLEVYGEKVVLETAVPGLKRAVSRFLGRDAVKTALAVPTVRAALSALGKKLLRSHGTEITTEVLQEAATIVGGWASAKASGIENPLFTSEHGQRLWDTAVQTAQAMTIAATPGPLFEMGGDLVNIRRARLNQARLAEAVAKVNGRKLTAEDPHTTSELIQSIAEAQDQPHVYVKKEAIRKFFQDAGVEDVDAAMARTLPDGGRAFLDAPENGDVAIPAGEFLARWAPSGAYPALAADMRLSPSDMTPREAEEAEAQRDKLIEELVERGKRLPPAPDDVAVFEDVSRKLRDTGRFSDEAADTNARLWQAFFRAMAARWNEGRPEGDASRVTARELYGQFEVAVESEGRAGLRPLGRAAVAPAAPSAAVVPAGTEASVPPEAGALNARFAAVDDAGRLASTKKWEHGVEPGEAERAAIEERDAVLAALRDVAPELVQHLSPELQAHWSAAMESERYGADDAERLARVIERYVAAGDFEDARRALARLRDAGDDVEAAELPDEVRAGHAAANAVIGPLRARLAARIEAAEAEARSAGEGHDAAESAGTPVLRRKPSDVSPQEVSSDSASSATGKSNPSGVSEKTLLPATQKYLSSIDEKNIVSSGNESGSGSGEGTDIDSSTKSIPPSGDDGATRTLFDSEEQPPLPGVEPATAKRGYIELPGAGGRSYRIALLERANLSTFLHESGHFFLEVLGDLGARENAPAALKADLARACEWLGAETVAGLTEDQHERFARAFEAYLREGSAPSVELVGIFQRFSAWLLEVYRSLRGLRVELDDEIRATFDRLLASDDELKNAELLNVVQNIFPNAEAAGMSPAEYQDYVDAVTRAHGEAERELLSTLIDEQARERSRAYLAEKDKLTDQMTDAVDRDPAVRIRTLLETGRLPETEETPDELRDVKLDRGAVEEVVGPQATRRMRNLTEDPTGRLFDGGPRIVHPDDLAGLFGYESGAAMLEALAATKRRDAEIAARVDARMKELFPPAAESGELAEKALKAVHGDARGRVLQHELRALARRVGGGASPMEMVREAARRIVGETPVREIHPEIYRRGEAKAARAALDAAARGDWAAAFKAKQEQILNWNLYREAKDARDGADAIARHMARLSGSAAQSRIGKAGGTYLEQINAFLDRFEFRRITDTRLERRLSLRQWIDEQRAADSEVAIPEYLVDEAFRKNYRELTWEQLRDVKESVANIEHLARLKRTLLIAGKAREWAAAKASLLRRLRQSYPDRAPIPLDRRTKEGIQAVAETAKAALKRMDASLLKVEQLVMWLDGGDGEGPWHELVWNPIADAEHEENRLNEAATLRLLQLFEELPKEQRERLYHKQVFIPSLGQPMTYQAMIAAALNYGNESNYDKVVRGAPMDVKAWGPEVVEDILAHLSKEDWDFVQGVWDLLDAELWPKVADLEKRQTGTTPPKIQGRKFQRRFSDGSIREYRGGYYPVIYNPEQDFYGRLQADEHSTTSTLFDHGYVKAATPHGYTNARTKYAGPILLSLDVLPRHIAQVCHDVAHREAIQQAYRVVTDPEIRAELVKALGRPYADALVDWVKYVANSQAMAMTDAARFWSGTVFGNLRRNAAIAAMGFKATTTIAQLAGYSMSLDLVKGKYLRLGLQEFLRNPKAAVEWIESISGEMKERWKNLDRDANDRIRELTKRATPLSKMQRVAMHGIGYFDLAVSGPTWIAGYRQGLAEGLDEDAAVRQADRAVMLSQGGGAAKDLSAIQQAGGALRLLTMFYTFFNVLYARGRDMGHVVSEEWGRGQHGRAFVDLFTRSWFLFIVPALLSEILAHRGPDDDEGWGEWAMRKALVYPFLTIPVLRDVATSIAERHVSYRFSPVASALEKLVSAGRGVLDGDVGKVGRSSVDLAGYGLGLPTGQARISATYLWDLASGEEHPDSAWDVVRDVMFSRPPHKDAKKRREGGR